MTPQQYSKPCCTARQLSHGYDRLRLPQRRVRANRRNKASPFMTGPLCTSGDLESDSRRHVKSTISDSTFSSNALVRLDVGRPNHLAPLLDVGLDAHAEFIRRAT